MFGAAATPAAALAFEAAVDAHLDVLFDHSTAGTHRSDLASDRSAQCCWDQSPVIYAVAIAQHVAKERVKLFGSALLQGTLSQGFQDCFAIGLLHRSHDALILAPIIAHQLAHTAGNVPAVQEPNCLRKFSFSHPLQTFIAIA